ncbi:MAG: putative integral rane protein [Patescibacteria group bacterium]|nr:putative integral rane protein [Patescibacteria group bacterium]
MVYNPYLVVPFATWAVAQVGKFALAALRGRVDFRYLYASGGMPSVHSAVVCSLATTALLVDGVGGHLFGFAAIFAVIVMYDSFGVRRSTGEQAVAINMLIESMNHSKVKLTEPGLRLREILGHQPREVSVGAVLGVVLACLFNYDRLGKFGEFLQAVPQKTELWAYLGVFGVMIVGGLVARLVLRARYRKSQVMKKLAKRIFTAAWSCGWLGLVSLVLVYEHASYFAWRVWPVAVIAAAVLWGVWLATASYRAVPATLAAEATEARKRKWLTWGRGKGGKAKRA